METFSKMAARVLALLMVLMTLVAPTFADTVRITQDDASLHMVSSVVEGAGVVVPDGAELVGNLLIEYSSDGNVWIPVTSASVNIDNLGEEDGLINLRASYYGNYSNDYSCSVVFDSDGWVRSDGRSVQSRAVGDSGASVSNSNTALPIEFRGLNIDVAGNSRSTDGDEDNVNIEVVKGANDNSFRLRVPVQKPINGKLVATLEAAWAQGELPSGEYEADITIEVTAE